MKIWDSQKFDNYIDNAVKMGELDGKRIEGRMDVYNYLAEKTVTKTNTVQRWRKEGSPGPGKEKKVLVIEKIFGTSFRKEVIEDDSYKKKSDLSSKQKYSDYVKSQVYALYDMVKVYLSSGHIPNQEDYEECAGRVYNFRVAVPDDVFWEIVRFFYEDIDPIVKKENKMKSYYEELFYREDLLHMGEREKEMMKYYQEKELELVKKFEKIADRVIHPIIMS